MKFYLFGSLRSQKRRARDVDLAVDLDGGEGVEQAMAKVAEIGPRVRKPIELWLSWSESEPNLAGSYDYRSDRWAFWRRPGMGDFFRGLEPVTLDHVVRLALAVGPYGPSRRGDGPEPDSGPECTVRRSGEGWAYELDGERGEGFDGPVEAAAGAERAAKARGAIKPAQVLWFRLG